MDKTYIYTDGSSRGNPGPGGWGAVIVSASIGIIELGGRENKTTNNRMEMMAAIAALGEVLEFFEKNKKFEEVELHSDSAYLLNGITSWVSGWQKNGWRTKTGEEVLNRDLWEKLSALKSKLDISFKKVVGHSGHEMNERCDEIATSFADESPTPLYRGSRDGYKIKIDDGNRFDQGSGVKKNSQSSSRSSAKAYSYVSLVNKVVQVHKTWAECEKRVRGAKGARYKKALDPKEEKELIDLFTRE